MSAARLTQIRDLIQNDVNQRGLQTDPGRNLINACSEDFAAACASLANHPAPVLGVLTGFYIPHAQPPCGETDGPLGAIYLARTLLPLGIKVVLLIDAFGRRALEAGLRVCGLQDKVPILTLPGPEEAWDTFLQTTWQPVATQTYKLTHLLALERVGPSHTLESLRSQLSSQEALGETYLDFLHEVPSEQQNRCHTMRGIDITEQMSPGHLLFDSRSTHTPQVVTIGIGDGGNEIGMGKIPWEVIRRNIPRGELIACRVPTDFLIVCGVSNWGAYALAVGVWCLRGKGNTPSLYNAESERRILQVMVEQGPLVDGVVGRPTVSVDGLTFERYIEPLVQMATITRGL